MPGLLGRLNANRPLEQALLRSLEGETFQA